jgi:ABC-2 type transport system permease protein
VTGVRALLRFQFRRDRIRLPAWTVVIVIMVIGVGSSWDRLYPTDRERRQLAEILSTNPTVTSLLGPLYDPMSSGGLTAWRMGVGVVLALGVLFIFTVTRHLRAEEESGRAELLLAAPLDRVAPVNAVLLLTLAASASFAVLAALGMLTLGFEFTGSLVLALAAAACGWVFAAVTAVVNQLARTERGSHAGAGLILGGLWVLAIIGNLQNSWLVWLSPFGWVNQAQPFAADHWWVVVIPVAATLALWMVALALADSRDLGAGLVSERVGPARASSRLTGPSGLAWRLDGATLMGWVLAFIALGVVIGLSRNTLVDFSQSSPSLTQMIQMMGGSQAIIDAFISVYLGLGALAVGFFAVSMVMRIHTEEVAGRAGLLLSTATARGSWASAHLGVAVVGAIAIMAALGATMGAGLGLVGGTGLSDVGPVTATALGAVPAVLFVAGLTMLIVGVWPRLVMLAWVLMAAFAVIGELGPILGLPDRVLDLSPFAHVPRLPGDTRLTWSIGVLLAAAVVMVVLGLFGLRRRDVTV